MWPAQRYAVDYEQLDAGDHIYSGEKEDPGSYTIYGQEAIADATVEASSQESANGTC